MHRESTPRELRRESNEIQEPNKGRALAVTNEGGPVGEIKPKRGNNYTSTETAVELFRSLPPIDYERFRADLDAVTDQAPTPLA